MKKLISKTSSILLKTISNHWLKIMLIACFAYTLIAKDLSFQLKMNSIAQSSVGLGSTLGLKETLQGLYAYSNSTKVWDNAKRILQEDPVVFAQKTTPVDPNLANSYSNMSFLEVEKKAPKYISKQRKKEAYIQRFAKLAQAEMRKYRIPASIILAQGLIETNAGESRLSTRNNNHFGIKCFSKKCRKGHCSNFTDDSHKDFFRIYKNAWESYRGHSLMLQGKRYRHLTKLAITDYKNWAIGLKKAGYATDPKYAFKLIHLIENLKLYQYDK